MGKLSHHYQNLLAFATIVCTKAGEKKRTFISLLISHLSILFDSILCFGGVGRAMEDLLWI